MELFREADRISRQVMGNTSPNPPVGALILDPEGTIIGRGATQPAGGAHAEVMAVRDALRSRRSLTGCRAVVTLEPCNHTGRTGPCSEMLREHGVSRVDFLFADPHKPASGGAATLREAGVTVEGPYLEFPLKTPHDQPVWALEAWLTSVLLGRPHVTLKWASTVDGHIAARDGSSQWITGEMARHHVHEDRSHRDAIVVGTGTVRADNPRLNARQLDGSAYPVEHQPLRVVVGRTPVPSSAAIIGTDDRFLQVSSHDVHDVLAQLHSRGVVSVLIEGGATLLSAFVEAGCVDEIHAYLAPAILGGGQGIFGHAHTTLGRSMDDIVRFIPRQMERMGNGVHSDYRWTMTRPWESSHA
ncbi:bifunctional diaminohydroxyphosphoribosylaminopyrimidine deaminase/5-amino-6-(5-phosphoribosylamino)uracil reductase RibD [Corynebacterium sp. zg254]|uniref:Riboflavin biosynthesis protein RibD n=1 Tax=Corynebacterium zhongnanshanii TaxID=2768834 RepID=A0ABQ6VGL8_9CORY|nr:MULTISPECIES: bifunctional diaminohydroxyphosphoribosylaminopyrimidine deaminase/5-amino-6-(5-phosphoribosylamino)uracil reductase RibD [Corynebacterium]KAB3523463.1 bifunctional diaminohydroxyphosphoribosylaminopyrimidine deaminase/5-amino-6-(5-phosphoribosylamino)uracil reductase RibD [Corynebacterium zhongnanshanii]MCR5913396.1 bifunctional diaminohydroxyphosphoribosylaminopyrimidine deaminase/5-amino-6-(5-phosphoribosylamino)uracil reductase RibD [Corynebacterium sp. zg254]